MDRESIDLSTLVPVRADSGPLGHYVPKSRVVELLSDPNNLFVVTTHNDRIIGIYADGSAKEVATVTAGTDPKSEARRIAAEHNVWRVAIVRASNIQKALRDKDISKLIFQLAHRPASKKDLEYLEA